MPKKRLKTNKGLPEGWRIKNGAYRYRVPKGSEAHWDNKKEFTLGKKLSDAWKVWASRQENKEKATTIGQLLDRYALEEIPKKAPRTQIEYINNIKWVRIAFGGMLLNAITPQDIYKYYDKRQAKTQARHEIALLKHAFSKAVEWGAITRHPFKAEVRLDGSKPRTRYITDDEIKAVMSIQKIRQGDSTDMLQAYIGLKILTGLRQGDMLRLKKSDLKEDGIHVKPNKTQNTTGNAFVISWSDLLRKAVDKVITARPVDISPWLFCNKMGHGYMNEHGVAEGFKSIWQRFMERLLKKGIITERFTEHDIRAKTASDAVSTERAAELLGHSDSRVTDKIYRRKVKVVEPLR